MQMILLYLFLPFVSCLSSSLDNISSSSSLGHRTIVTNGNYSIFFCEKNINSAGIVDFLPQVRGALQFVLQDLENGIASRHGYRTFFKSNANLPHVKQVFQAIAEGQNLQSGKPVIECLNPYTETPAHSSAFSTMCVPKPGHEMVRAAAFPPNGITVICPDFWTHPAFSEGADACPLVTWTRRRRGFADEGRELTDTQFTRLVSELVRLYNPLNGLLEEDDVYGAQKCFELDVEKSVRNAGNWALYAACKLVVSYSPVFLLSILHARDHVLIFVQPL